MLQNRIGVGLRLIRNEFGDSISVIIRRAQPLFRELIWTRVIPDIAPHRAQDARWGPRSAVVAPLRRGPHGADCAPWGGSAGRLAALGATPHFTTGCQERRRDSEPAAA